LNALGRLLAVGSEWASYATLVPTGGARKAARAAADEASEQLGRQGARQAAQEGLQQVAQPRAALPPRVFLTQKRLEHIVERHWATSGHNTPSAGKFMAGMTARRLKDMIKMAAERGVWYPDPRIPRRRRIEYDFGWQIGVDQFQYPATRIRVVVEPTGEVVTAFPIR
jgi:hypothetical protein